MQQDYVVENGPGLAVRTDINEQLHAIVTLNSGSAPPVTTYPGMLWLDLSDGTKPDGVLRLRNQANQGWLNYFTNLPEFEALEARVDQNTADIDALTLRMDDVEPRLVQAEADIDGLTNADVVLQQDIAALDTRVDAVEAKNTTQDNNITALGGRMATAESNITALQASTGNNAAAIAELDTRVDFLEQNSGGGVFTEYAFSLAIATPPGAGEIRMNNAAPASTTALYVHNATASGQDVRHMFDLIQKNALIVIQDKDQPTKYQEFQASGAAIDRNTYWEIPVTFVKGGSALTAERVLFAFMGGGESGAVWRSDAAPADPSKFPMWFHTTKLALFVWYDDGNTSQWVDVSAAATGLMVNTLVIAGQDMTMPHGGMPSITDYNAATMPGYYIASNTATNGPVAQWCFVEVLRSDNTPASVPANYTVWQRAFTIDKPPRMFVRCNPNGSGWSNWLMSVGGTLQGDGFFSAAIGGSIELGRTDIDAPAFIDFHSKQGVHDYDARIIVQAGISGTNGRGTMAVNAGAINMEILQDGGLLTLRPYGQPLRAVNVVSPSRTWMFGPDTGGNYIVYNEPGQGVYLGWGATAWTSNSDARLKDVSGPIPDALAKLQAIAGVSFTWKADADKVPRVGVIAQDVQAVLPEAVTEGAEGMLGVAYTELVPLLVEAVKALSNTVDELRAKLDAIA